MKTALAADYFNINLTTNSNETMEYQSNETQAAELTKTTDGIYDSFTITLPAGDLQTKHFQSYLNFLGQLDTSEVLKTMITVFFTAINDETMNLTEEQKLHYEKLMLSMVDHMDVKLCKLN